MSDAVAIDPADVPMATAELLTSKRDTGTETGFPEDFVVVDLGLGTGLVKVRIRGLSRHETLHIHNQKGALAVEQMTVSLGMVEPPMTPDQVKAWQKRSTGNEIEPVTQRIGELSGLLQGSRKDAIKEMLTDPSVEFRVLPGDEDGHDGGPDARGDEQ